MKIGAHIALILKQKWHIIIPMYEYTTLFFLQFINASNIEYINRLSISVNDTNFIKQLLIARLNSFFKIIFRGQILAKMSLFNSQPNVFSNVILFCFQSIYLKGIEQKRFTQTCQKAASGTLEKIRFDKKQQVDSIFCQKCIIKVM